MAVDQERDAAMSMKITPRRIVNALKTLRWPGNPHESYPMAKWRLGALLGLKTKAENEELGRVLKWLWPHNFQKWGVSHGYYPTGWRVRLKVQS